MLKNKQSLSLRERLIQVMFPLLFLMGCLIVLYPLMSNYYYRVKQNQAVTSFESAKVIVNKDDINDVWL